MSTTRVLLDCLGRATLVRLSRDRGLAATRENDERRKALAYSYRGDVETLIHDLSRTELIEIFRSLTFFSRREEVYLPNPGKYRLDELRAFAVRAFAGRPVRIAGDFRPARELQEGRGADEEALLKSDQGDVERLQGDDEAQLLTGLTRQWSRPRMISRVLQMLGHEIPERLRTTRFQQLVADLEAMGIEACRADDPACAPVDNRADSPGIDAKLRLRLAVDAAPGADDDGSMDQGRFTNDGDASARGSSEARRGQRDHEAGPTIVIQPGEQPVSQRIPRPSDYNLAVLRLQFLTAVPIAQRRSMPEWPSAYLAAATRGLHLRPQEASLLRAYSAGLCLGNHSPYDAIPHLTQVMRPTEWEQLLEDFVSLNPSQPEFVNAIVEQIRPVAAPRTAAQTWREAEPAPADLREMPSTPSPGIEASPLAASKRGTAEREQEPASNVRDLGALKGMFDDE